MGLSRSRKRKKRSSRSKAIVKRKLSSFEELYLEQLRLFDDVLATTVKVSQDSGEISTDGRGIRGMKIFTRQTLMAMSLRSILPFPTIKSHQESISWDISAIASLTRNLIEGYLSLHYFGIEQVSDEEAELRFFLLQLHHNKEWEGIRKLETNSNSVVEGQQVIEEQIEKIRNHPFLSKLNSAQKNKALQGHEMYKTKAEFEKELEICRNLRRDYRYLSNFVHPLPISIERMDNHHGRGVGNDRDVVLCIYSLICARMYLATSCTGIFDYFNDSKLKKYTSDIEAIRAYSTGDFLELFDEG